MAIAVFVGVGVKVLLGPTVGVGVKVRVGVPNVAVGVGVLVASDVGEGVGVPSMIPLTSIEKKPCPNTVPVMFFMVATT